MSAALNEDPPTPPDENEVLERARAAITERAPKRFAKRDAATMTISAFNADGSPAGTFDAHELSQTIMNAMALDGAWAFIRGAPTPEEGWVNLKAGKLPKQRYGEKAPRQLSLWKQATAHALVERTRKSDSPYTLETALDRVRELTRDELVKNKSHPLVVKHYHKLAGTTAQADTLDSLI
jgi:hypothetical protein